MTCKCQCENKIILPDFGQMLWKYRGEPGMLIPLLQAAQEAYGYLPPQSIEQISDVTGISTSEIFGVITFYKQFRLHRPGKNLIKLCKGTACHVVGANMIGQTLEEELGVAADETTSDGLFTFTEVACLGCCSLAPVIMVGDQTFGRLTPQKIRSIIRRYRNRERQAA
jgi:NADH:ubiquinone oxidoreductase subunit E